MTDPWNGHPLMNADRDGWHLLRFEDQKHPEPMWWVAEAEGWFADPAARVGMAAEVAEETGYTYVAGVVTPEEWEERSVAP